MSGFTYGTGNGARYGTSDGGRWGGTTTTPREPPDPAYWNVERKPLAQLIGEERSWDELVLKFRADLDMVQNRLRPLDDEAGHLERIPRSDGGFDTTDRASGANTWEFIAPEARRDVRYVDTWLVDEYQEKVIDQAGERFEVTLTLVPVASKEPQDAYGTATKATDEWHFGFQTGEFATKRVEAGIGSADKQGLGESQLELFLTARQVRILEENASTQHAVAVREVPDGPNYAKDENGSNTVAVTPPDGKESNVPDGSQVVTDWTTTLVNDAYYRVRLKLTELG